MKFYSKKESLSVIVETVGFINTYEFMFQTTRK